MLAQRTVRRLEMRCFWCGAPVPVRLAGGDPQTGSLVLLWTTSPCPADQQTRCEPAVELRGLLSAEETAADLHHRQISGEDV